MITVWGRASSSNVMKVLWLCDELGERYTRVDAGGAFGRTREPDYLRRNPNGLVPTIEEADGFVLWESQAILRYLANSRAGGERFYPADPRARARVDQWLDWVVGSLAAPATTLFFTHIRLSEGERDWPAHDRALLAAKRLWTIADAALDGQDYLCGRFSLADIALAIHAHRWFQLPLERPALPHLAAWYDRLNGHAGFRTHMAVPLS